MKQSPYHSLTSNLFVLNRVLRLDLTGVQARPWNLLSTLELFPKLMDLGLFACNDVLLYHPNFFLQHWNFPEQSLNHPLRRFSAPIEFKASQLLWILFHCSRLRDLHVWNIDIDVNIKEEACSLPEKPSLAHYLRRFTASSFDAFLNPNFDQLLQLISNITELDVNLEADERHLEAASQLLPKILLHCSNLERIIVKCGLIDPRLLDLPPDFVPHSRLQYLEIWGFDSSSSKLVPTIQRRFPESPSMDSLGRIASKERLIMKQNGIPRPASLQMW